MSNLRNTTRLPLRTSMANKSKSHALTNDLLERKTRALEGSLNKLKLTTQRDQIKSTMETYRRVKQTSQYSRDKPAVKPTVIKQTIKCGQCEKVEAKMKCLECVEVYCASCYSQFHLRGALQRHHCILLPPSSKKNPTLNTDINLSDSGETHNESTNVVSFQQSFLQWREDNINKSKKIQQRHGVISPTHNRIDHSSKLPSIESSKTTSDDNILSTKYRSGNQQSTTINVTKKDQPKINVRVRVRHSFSDHTSLVDIEPSNDNLSITRTEESTEIIPAEENSSHDYNLVHNETQERPITHVSIRSLSRPTSSSIKKDLLPSRSNSISLPAQSLRSVLATKSTDELAAIVNSQLVLSRASTSPSDKLDQPSNWRPLQNTSNNINAQSVVIDQNTIAQSDSVPDDLFGESKIELAYQINSAKDQPSAYISAINYTATTPRRHSPFSFSNSLYKMSRMDSASSRDTGDGGFFTDVLPRRIIPSPPLLPPPPILECSTSNEWKHALENQLTESNPIPLPKLSIPSLSRASSKHSITHEEINHRLKFQIDDDSRPGSSLSSSSLPISINSSKPDFNDSNSQSSTTSSRKSSASTINNSSSATSTLKNSTSTTTTKDPTSSSGTTKTSSVPSSTSKDTSSATTTTKTSPTSKDTSSATATTNTSPTSKDTSSVTTTTKTSSTSTPKPTLEKSTSEPEPIVPIITKDEKVPSPCDTNECLQESMNSLKDKSSSNAQASEDANDSIEPTSTTYLTREVNITENDLPTQKKTRRHVHQQPTTTDESQFRKLEFSIGDGLKWQEASVESMSSTKTIISKQLSAIPTPQSLSPPNSINTKLAEQFSTYDNDDGRSSRTYQNLNDEECFNQLRHELCSELDIRGSDEDALLNEHLLRILQDVKNPFAENDLQMIETKLRENESIHQPSMDNELLIHE